MYLFSPDLVKKDRNNNQIFKIIALELNITSDLSLQLNVKTFSNILLRRQMEFSKRKFNEYPKYTFVHSSGALKRILKSDNIQNDNQYILKQTSRNGILTKSIIPFLNFKNLNEFNNSKIGILNSALLSIQDKLSKYLSIEFKEIPVNKTIRYKELYKIDTFKENVYLLDLIQDEISQELILQIQDELNTLIPKAKVKVATREHKNEYNLILIHNRAYYEKYEIKDPYKPNPNRQYFTIEDSSIGNRQSILKVLITESIIKNDIKNNQISIVNWKDYGFTGKWVFGDKVDNKFCFLTIYPDGKLKFENFEPNLFNQNEYNQLCEIFNEEENVELIVKDEKGNINFIRRTPNFSLPEFSSMFNILDQEASKLTLSKDDAIKYITEVFEDSIIKQKDIINKVNSLVKWNKIELLSCFINRNDKKKFVQKVEVETGEILKSYLRDKTRYEILDSQLDIHLLEDDGTLLYYVGTKGKGIKEQITRASIIRELKTYQNSEIIFDKLLPLMNVDFVKNGDLTVLPFPMKYLKEWEQY